MDAVRLEDAVHHPEEGAGHGPLVTLYVETGTKCRVRPDEAAVGDDEPGTESGGTAPVLDAGDVWIQEVDAPGRYGAA